MNKDMHGSQCSPADFDCDGRTVVVADDDDEFRQALAEIVELDGWRVWQARDGQEALDCTLKLRPNVLVLDHRMPTLTGVEVVQRLREARIGVPVVFVTAAYEIEELAASVGVLCRLRKPFGFDDLSRILERARQGDC